MLRVVGVHARGFVNDGLTVSIFESFKKEIRNQACRGRCSNASYNNEGRVEYQLPQWNGFPLNRDAIIYCCAVDVEDRV